MSTPEIITVNSEQLEATIRDLLPSQAGFGSELQASNVITPIIDLTASAEGSSLPAYLQQALSFDSQTAFEANNSSVVIANSPGFYRILANASSRSVASGSGDVDCQITMTDGSTTKIIWQMTNRDNNEAPAITANLDFIVYLNASESISAVTNAAQGYILGSSRQIADVSANLINPAGLVLE